MSEQMRFKVNVQVKSVVGKDLINDDNIAITELVKNGYDAGSSKVIVRFNNIANENTPPNDSIVIQDFGSGMSRDDIENKWLNIAYSAKKRSRRFENRTVAGNKGIGRFSCDRLGEKLYLYTKVKNESDYTCLEIDWTNFELDDQNIQIIEIPVNYSKIEPEYFKAESGFEPFDKGTILKITRLRDAWPKSKLISLRRALERFANPNQAFDKNSFKIFLECPEYKRIDRVCLDEAQRVNGEVQNLIFDKLDFKATSIESSIDSKGEHIETKLFHRGDCLFTLVERNKFTALKEMKIVIYYLNQYHKAYFKRQTGFRNAEYGSVFLFMNGFRVPPYGERQNDWLRLDNRKLQGTGRFLGCREVLGRIEIDDPLGEWKIVSSREGMVHNEAFLQLITPNSGYFHKVFRKLEKYVVDGLSWDSIISHQIDEEKLHSPKWTTDKEEYKETEGNKEKRVLSLLQGIVLTGTDPDDIVSLEFDPQLIEMLKQQDEKEIESFFQGFEDLNVKAPRESLAKSINSLRRGLAEVQAQRAKEKIVLEKTIEHAIELEKKVEHETKEKEKFEKEAQSKEEENLFLKATTSRDLHDVIDLHHQIIISSSIIEKDTEYLLGWIEKQDKFPDLDKIKSTIDRINFQNKKVLQVSKFATKANFKVGIQGKTIDIVKFIKTYLDEIIAYKYFKKISINYKLSKVQPFIINFKPIEITILIDNLITNAIKANSPNFEVEVLNVNDKSIDIIFKDDGDGLSPGISDPNAIFERGFTTTTGSGIGLAHVAKIVKTLRGTMGVVASDIGGFALRVRLIK